MVFAKRWFPKDGVRRVDVIDYGDCMVVKYTFVLYEKVSVIEG